MVRRSRLTQCDVRWPPRGLTTIFGLAALGMLAGCGTMPLDPFAQLAASADLETGNVSANGHTLRFYRRAETAGGPPGFVTVYLEGDGKPWAEVNRVAADPTTRDPVALRLMALDKDDVLYLARPCYHGLDSELCGARMWTRDRYSNDVIDAMGAAIERLVPPPTRIRLVGYSGGGVLATQLARRIDRVEALVTLAANLDTVAWTTRHAYSPLSGSLNPADAGPLPPRISQYHLFGGRDENVPVGVAERFLHQQGDAWVVVFADFDHRCCWKDIWPKVLQAMAFPGGFCSALKNIEADTTCGLATP